MGDKTFLLIFFFGCIGFTFPQSTNLIPNPSFEQFYMEDQEVKCSDWAFTNSVDYFSTQHKQNLDGRHNIATAPKNFAGYQTAQDGNAYLGFVFLYPIYKYREFLSTKLMTPMIKGANYDIEFYVSLSDSSKYTTNSIIFWLSEDIKRTIKRNSYTMEAAEPIDLENLYFDKENWTKVHYIYTAKGDEEYFTIGNCASCTTKWQYIKLIKNKRKGKRVIDDNKYSVYYYVDNISVTRVVTIPSYK